MFHETLHYSVPRSAVEPCREAVRELVSHVKQNEPETLFYTVLEEKRDDESTFLHVAGFETETARQQHRESEAMKLFTDLVYPATRKGFKVSRQKVVDRLPTERMVLPRR